ncbi:hypothetical protein V2G26_010996 [Clonostachys chloroleuca]
MPEQRKLRVALVGLGRMGQIHAKNYAFLVPRAEVIAVCDVRDASLEWAKENLNPAVQTFKDAEDMFKNSGAEVVLIATETSKHAPLTELAISNGLHVLLEKPIAVDIESSQRVVEHSQKHPHIKTMVAFNRRFDESNLALKAAIDAGDLGKVHLFRSWTADVYDPSGFFINFSKSSGGLFTDVGVHDVDLARWFTNMPSSCPNPKQEVTKVFAVGQQVRHPELRDLEDADNGDCIIEFTNGTTAVLHFSRTGRNGSETFIEVCGTEQRVAVNPGAEKNKLQIRDKHGVRTECHQTVMDRFKDAFIRELQVFTDCVLDDTPLPVSLEDALQASKVCYALTLSFRSGQPVYFDENGNIIPPVQ